MAGPIGLIVKGGSALFLRGPDPGAATALFVIDHYRLRDFEAVSEQGLEIVPRPTDLSMLAWKYGFFTITGQRLRLVPGPFDSELEALVKTLAPAPPDGY